MRDIRGKETKPYSLVHVRRSNFFVTASSTKHIQSNKKKGCVEGEWGSVQLFPKGFRFLCCLLSFG